MGAPTRRGEDGSVRLWNVTDPKVAPRVLTQGGADVRTLAFSPDGQHLVAGNAAGELISWTVETRALTEMVCALVKRELSTAEFAALIDPDLGSLASVLYEACPDAL